MAGGIGEPAGQFGPAARADGGEPGLERAKTILTEVLDATRSAVEALLDEQKQQAAERVKGIAVAVRCAAQSLERSDSRAIARYAERAADQIEGFSLLIRERRWGEIVADTGNFARRRPSLFLLGAAAAGYLAGRLLSVPTDRQRPGTIPRGFDLSPHRGETDEITAAIATATAQPASGNGKIAGYGVAAETETR
ncbi:MAG TPA: hypothetical protein VKG22_04745 [Stellaceae bacterium]|nr:hypothetical protein [Stellaceae bacterium]